MSRRGASLEVTLASVARRGTAREIPIRKGNIETHFCEIWDAGCDAMFPRI